MATILSTARDDTHFVSSTTEAVPRPRKNLEKNQPIPVAVHHSFVSTVRANMNLRKIAANFAVFFVVTTLAADQVFAQTCELPAPAHSQFWRRGWDKFDEPLNYAKSQVFWATLPSKILITIFNLRGAQPSKLYQVGVHLFCTVDPGSFGQFPTDGCGCPDITRQGVTAKVVAVELGVVTTDVNGNGCFGVIVGPIAPGTYRLEFTVRDGAGCNLTGGFGSCDVDFQSPGPFGRTTRIVVQ
jgi:hypothetical protein